jgi:hypothetical protein
VLWSRKRAIWARLPPAARAASAIRVTTAEFLDNTLLIVSVSSERFMWLQLSDEINMDDNWFQPCNLNVRWHSTEVSAAAREFGHNIFYVIVHWR